MGVLVRPRQSLEYRGPVMEYRHVYSKDTGKCLTCGQKKPVSRRKPPIVIAMTLAKGWRVIARPLSYRVQRLQPCLHAPGGNPVWADVQRIPRTRNAWIDQEMQAAVSMLERRFREAANNGTQFLPPPPKPALSGWAPHYVRSQLTRRRDRIWFCYNVLVPEAPHYLQPSWWRWRIWSWKQQWQKLLDATRESYYGNG